MGQRFQIIENTNGVFKIYHSQWLWGDYAIRRLGTAVKNFLLHNKDRYRSFEDYLKGSFYGEPNDMNKFDRYFDNNNEFNDNKEIFKVWRGNKYLPCQKKNLRTFLRTLDNNDGYFYIEFNEKWINGQKGIKGYCFLTNKDIKCISAKEYIKIYGQTEGFSKKQFKEFNRGMKTFEKLKLIDIPNIIYKKQLGVK